MSMKTLPGTPTERDISTMVEQFGAEAVQVWLLLQIYHTRRKAALVAEHLREQWLGAAAFYSARYQELMLQKGDGDHDGDTGSD